MTPYDFARLFQAQYASYTDDFPFWLSQAKRFGSPILELGCGPGRLLAPLLKAGHQVTGVDQDLEMLRRARRSLPPELQGDLSLLMADFRSFIFPSQYRLAMMACNTLAGIPPRDVLASFERIHHALLPGGALAIELPNPNPATWDLDPDDTETPIDAFIDPDSGNPIQLYCEQKYDPKRSCVWVAWRYDELQGDGSVQAHHIQTAFHLWTQIDLRRTLEQAGFPTLDFYGDYSMPPFQSDSPKMLVCAASAHLDP